MPVYYSCVVSQSMQYYLSCKHFQKLFAQMGHCMCFVLLIVGN